MTKQLEVSRSKLELGQQMIQEITDFQAYSSISFFVTDEILESVQVIKSVAKHGMAKNRHKMKAAVVDILDTISSVESGDPANLNLTEYEHKSVEALKNLLNRVLEDQKDGIVVNETSG